MIPAEGSITGWIIATDLHDARRQASAVVGSAEAAYLAAELYRLESLPPGKHQITATHIALVS